MANNRLYIGNRREKEYAFLCKGWGLGWQSKTASKNLKVFLDNTETFIESNGEPTELFLFSEDDEVSDSVFKSWDKIETGL